MDDKFGRSGDVFRNLQILIHADDANLLATTRDLMIQKITFLLEYCYINSILLQASKCWFTVINGQPEDTAPLQVENNAPIKFAEYLEILGSHISGSLTLDLELHFKKRFKNCIKYFNYIKVNRLAPISVKLKVLKSCVVTTLLYNCEAFGHCVPDGLEEVYYKMLRAALGVRTNCPKLLLLIEAGFLPTKCLIESRQLKFFRKFQKSLQTNGTRLSIFSHLLRNKTSFLNQYVRLDNMYATSEALVDEQRNSLKLKIRNLGRDKDKHYRFWIYLQLNPDLTRSPFLNRIDVVGKCIVKFRLGSHNLRIETAVGIEHRGKTVCVSHVEN